MNTLNFLVKCLIKMTLFLFLGNSLYAADSASCQGQTLQKTFSSGANWAMCWQIKAKEGLALSQVTYQAPGQDKRQVLGEAALSQVSASFDDGAIPAMLLTTEFGFGGDNALTLQQSDCPGGSLESQSGKPLLCTATHKAGYLYKYISQRQSESFEIRAHSQLGPRHYMIRWKFYENGTIEPAIGLTGKLSAVNESAAQFGWPINADGDIATGFLDHYLWRLDFDLNGTPGNDRIEEISSIPAPNRLTKSKTIETVSNEVGKNLKPDHKRFWRVLDGSATNNAGNPISYELVPSHYDQSLVNTHQEDWLNYDVYFTTYRNCERFAADNSHAGACGQDLTDYIGNRENLVNQDIVLWYKQNNHYLPRSEDSDYMGTRWSSFKLFPRDWHATNPF